MKKLNFKIDVQAAPEKIWAILWNEDSYGIWNAVISDGSYAVSNWQKGDKILFLSPEGNGLFSIISEKIPNELMAFRHLGVVVGKAELHDDPMSGEWNGLMEIFRLASAADGTTELSVEMDSTDDHASFFGNV